MREPDRLYISVYRKPTHTDQYLAYDLHHPQSVKRGIVKCLHDLAKRITTKPSGTTQENKDIFTVLIANSYPLAILQNAAKTKNPAPQRKAPEFKSTVVLLYKKEFRKLSAATYKARASANSFCRLQGVILQ